MQNKPDETKELKRKIRFLEEKLKQIQSGKNAKDLPEKEKLRSEINQKEFQIEFQKHELLRKQHELEASRDRYTDLYDSAPIGYLILDSKLVIKEINLTGTEILGTNRKYILNFPLINFFSNNQSKKFLSYFQNCKNQNSIMVDEFLISHTGIKKEKYIQLNSMPIHDFKSNELNFRVSLIDVTAKRKVENALKESEERFKLMADASPAMIWMTDENNKLIYLNKNSTDFYGRSSYNMNIDKWLEQTHPDDREELNRAFEKRVEDKKHFFIETRRKNKKGEYRWIFNSAAPRYLNKNEFAGYIGIGIDITEGKKIREEIESSLKEKEILLKEVHHRVKNNLQIISSILSLQTHYLGNKSIKEILAACRTRVMSMSLIHEQLYHTKDFLNINFENYINILIKQLVDTYDNAVAVDFRLDIEKVNIDVETSINLGLILNELITNSLKYAFQGRDKGLIKISLKLSKSRNDLILKVTDNGKGLPENFDIHNLNSLGLEIVTSLAEQLDGELKIYSNDKTEFQIILHNFEESI